MSEHKVYRTKSLTPEVIPGDMKYSVIMPTYNRSIQAMLTLAAFEKQTYPMDAFEVIVVNDGSTDDTLEKLRQCRTPYRLVILTLESTSGRSVARNAGVHAAQGEYLIFCDPDFVVTPRFIEVHADNLNRYPNTVISGVPQMWTNVYAQYFPDFSEPERELASNVLRSSGLWNETLENPDRIIEIVTPDDIREQTGKLERAVSPVPFLTAEILAEFSSTDVAPWLLCVTRCLSMSRSMFWHAGGFYEPFKMYGIEDWELGYRLHRLGYSHRCIDESIGYHQEHPSAFRNADVNLENIRMAIRMHGVHDPELSMFAVCQPSEDIHVYKNSLRKINALRNSPLAANRHKAAHLTLLCAHAAQLFVDRPDSEEYKQLKACLKQELIHTIVSNEPPPRKRRRRRLKRRRLRKSGRRLHIRRKARKSLRKSLRRSLRPSRRKKRSTAIRK